MARASAGPDRGACWRRRPGAPSAPRGESAAAGGPGLRGRGAMDPKLAERFRKQQEKEERDEELEVAEIGSAANKEKQLDPKLAARWAKQKQLEENGENVQVAEIGSACKASRDLDPKLAAAWAKQADQQEEAVEAAVKAMDELGSAAVV